MTLPTVENTLKTIKSLISLGYLTTEEAVSSSILVADGHEEACAEAETPEQVSYHLMVSGIYRTVAEELAAS